jgi:hypothetical protein
MRVRTRALIFILGSAFYKLAIAQSAIQSVQAYFDPAPSAATAVKILVQTSVNLTTPSNVSLVLQGIPVGGGAPYSISSPGAQMAGAAPTAAYFMVPISSLLGAKTLIYQVVLNQGSTQQSPAIGLSLDPIGDIQHYQSVIQQGVPTTPSFVAQRFSGHDLLLEVTTDKPGFVHAQVRNSTTDAVIEEHSDAAPFTAHKYTFSNILPGTNFYLMSTVVDPVTHKDVPGTTLSGKSYAAMQGQMVSPPSPPTISPAGNSIANSTAFTVEFTINQPAITEVNCFRIPDPTTPSNKILVSTPTAVKKDEFGLPSGTFVTGNQTAKCADLDPESTYIAEVTATDKFGQSASPLDISVTTPKKLDFDGTLDLTVSAKGLTFKWKSTVKDAGATFSVNMSPLPPVVQTVNAQSDGVSFGTTVDPSMLAAAYAVTPSGTPIYNVKLIDKTGKETAAISFSAAAEIASSTSAVSRTKAANASASTISALNSVASGVQNPNSRKFTWEELLQTGLGAFIRLVAAP